MTFKQLHHIPDKLLYQPEEPDNSGGLQNVLIGQWHCDDVMRDLFKMPTVAYEGEL